MNFKDRKINQAVDGRSWYFKLYYVDNMGYKVTVEGKGFKSRHQATWWATRKGKEIEKAKGLIIK